MENERLGGVEVLGVINNDENLYKMVCVDIAAKTICGLEMVGVNVEFHMPLGRAS